MRSLIAVATLGLALSFSSVSFASDFMSLYTKPVAKSEVKNEIKGGDVEKDFTSFYTSPKEWNTETSLRVNPESDNNGSYIVFGVQIPLKPKA